jgi:fructose-1,6-bisphosphatase/inositol monophosphatase family enzyme
VDTDAVTALLRDVADEVVRPRFRSLDADDVDEKGPGDLVTVADREAEALITRALHDAYPDAVVLGEEASAGDPTLLERYAAAEHAFTVDPVDGTKNFVHGSPDYAVMAAELRRGEVVRSWIWQPEHGLAFVAERGAGAFRNGERLGSLTPDADPARWRVRASRRSWVGRSFPGLQPIELSWVSCGVDYPQLVTGGCDVLVYWSTKPWDHAPGTLLVTETGGVHATSGGAPYDPRHEAADGLVAAATPEVYDGVRDRWHATADWR